MRTALFLLILSFVQNAYCQKTKMYDGIYKRGAVNYEYYIGKNNDTILNGKLLYHRNNSQNESGRYKNNLKTGTWKYSINNNSIKIDIFGNYNNNLKDGNWEIHYQNDEKNKVYSLSFKNDTLVSKLNFEGINGQFDEHGKFIGDWKVDYDNNLFDAGFVNNTLTKLEWRLDGRLKQVYRPSFSEIQLRNLAAPENPFTLKEYELDYNVRVMSGEFDVAQIYGLDHSRLSGAAMNHLDRELFYYRFFDAIESTINDVIFDEVKWEYLQLFKLTVNPYFPYSKVKAEVRSNKPPPNNLERFYDPKLVDEKPAFEGGNDTFITFVTENYRDIEDVSGFIYLDFIVDKEGKLKIMKVNCSGNISKNEVIRVLNSSPKWSPGKKDGKPVEVRFSIPINLSN